MPKGQYVRKISIKRCIKDAAKYSTKEEWSKHSSELYYHALSKDWLKECCGHMKREPKWTYEACKLNALEHSFPSDWKNASPTAYARASTKGWMKECTAHMQPNHGVSRKVRWTKEATIACARRFSSASEWSTTENGAYRAACVNGWLDECKAHMKKKISFSPEECMADALLYRSKEEWEEESPLIYGYAKKTNQIRKCVKAIKEHAITVRRSIAMRQALAVNALVKGSYYQASKPSLAKHQEEISLDPDSHLHNAIRFFIASQEEIPRVILSKRFGIVSKTFTNQAIGDELGVSRQRVNQIEKKHLALLQEKLSAEMPGLMVAMRSLKHKHELVSQLPATLNLFSKESKGVQFIEKLLGE